MNEFNSVGHYPNTALFILKPPKKKSLEQGSGLSSLGRIIRTHKVVSWCPPVFGKFPEGLLRPMPRRPLMVRAALLAATELRRSRCCDGVAAATDMRRPAPSRSFCASRRADADAATELMLRAALLRRSCDGVAAVTEQRRPAPSRSFCASRRADAAATELMLRAALLRRSCDGVAATTESLL